MIFRVFRKTTLLAGVFVLGVTSAGAETLTDALVAAYRNSNLLEQNRALLRVADENVAQTVAGLKPILSYISSAQATSPKTGRNRVVVSAGLSAEWLLYDFGATQLRAEAQKETVLATRQALIDIEQGVLLNAVQAYMNYRRAQEFVALAQSNTTLITRELRAANDRFEVGEITRTDVSLAQSRLAESRANLVSAQGQLADAREFYHFAVGRYPGKLAPPPRAPQTAKSQAAARAIAVRTHPNVKQAQHEVSSAELSVARVEASMKPRISVQGSFNKSSASAAYNKSVSLNVNAPIYRGGAQTSSYRAAFAQAEAARSGLGQTVRAIQQEVGNAWTSVQVARAQINASQERIQAARVAYRGIREEASLGARTTLDVLDAEQELLDAQNSLISAQADEYIAIYAVLSAMGLLTVEHLNLGVETYDPTQYYNLVKTAPASTIRGDKLDRVLRALGKK
ncbi:TolC family outer membrane protein [Brevirhabdus sp.]|uniref:TolC family outer membrane protein n=1 Tax=Brevirhabdus sp. TaxID=2004514 RepID=UPI00405A459F